MPRTRWRRSDGLLPSEVPNVKGWWLFDRVGQSDGSSISSVSDHSGNGLTATQATGSLQPVFRTNYQNGLGAAVFDGVDDCLFVATGAMAQPITVVAALKGAAQRYLSGTDDALRFGFDSGTGPNIYGGNGIGSVIGVAGSVPGAAKVVGSVANGTSSMLFMHDIHLQTADAGSATIPAGGVQLGRSNGQPWAGALLEIALFSRALR